MQWAISGNIRRMRRKSFIGQLVLVALGVELLLFASFTSLQLPTATLKNLERFATLTAQEAIVYLPEHWRNEAVAQLPALSQPIAEVRFSPYVPLIPTALFLGYALGVPLGLLSAFGFLLLGLLGPQIGVLPFAAGGGFEYCRQPTFGYLLGITVAAWFSGRVTMSANTSLRQLLAVAGGLVFAHGFGLLYLLGGALGVLLFEGDAAYLKWQPWLFENIRNLSWYALPYDAVFALTLVGLGFPVRWLTSVLTAPDIAMRPKRKWQGQIEQVS